MVRRELRRFRGRELDTAGDGFFAAFETPDAAVRCACAVMNGVADLGLQLRAGVHMGEAVEVDRKVGGMAVHIGARIAALAGPGEVLVSSTVRDLMPGSGVGFEGASRQTLKGVDEPWTIYRVRREGDLAPRPVAEITPPEAEERPGRSRRVVAIAALVAVAAAASMLLLLRPWRTTGTGRGAEPRPSSAAAYADGLYRIDPATNAIVEVGSATDKHSLGIPLPIVRDGDVLWVGYGVYVRRCYDVRKFNPASNLYVGTRIPLPGEAHAPPDIAVGDGSVWAMNHVFGAEATVLYEIDPSTNRRVGQVPLERQMVGLVVLGDAYWTATADGDVLRINPRTGETLQTVSIGGHPLALLGGEGRLWALDSDGEIERVDPSGAHRSVRVAEPLALAIGEGSVWVTTASGSLVRFDPITLDRTDTVQVGERAFGLSVGAGSVWVGTRGPLGGEGEIVRVDAESMDVDVRIPLGGRPILIGITAEDDAVWFGVATRLS